MTISKQQFTPEILAHIQALIDANPGWSRRNLSVQVREWLEWRSPNGKLKEMSCRVALLELECGGLLHLPPAGPAPPKRTRLEHGMEPFHLIHSFRYGCYVGGFAFSAAAWRLEPGERWMPESRISFL